MIFKFYSWDCGISCRLETKIFDCTVLGKIIRASKNIVYKLVVRCLIFISIFLQTPLVSCILICENVSTAASSCFVALFDYLEKLGVLYEKPLPIIGNGLGMVIQLNPKVNPRTSTCTWYLITTNSYLTEFICWDSAVLPDNSQLTLDLMRISN